MKLAMLSVFICIGLLCFVSAEHPLPTDLVDDDTGLFEGMGNWANNVTYGAFWTLLLLGFIIVMMIASMPYGVPRATGFGGFIALMGSISLATIGWMPWWIASLFIVAGAGAIVVMIKSR